MMKTMTRWFGGRLGVGVSFFRSSAYAFHPIYFDSAVAVSEGRLHRCHPTSRSLAHPCPGCSCGLEMESPADTPSGSGPGATHGGGCGSLLMLNFPFSPLTFFVEA